MKRRLFAIASSDRVLHRSTLCDSLLETANRFVGVVGSFAQFEGIVPRPLRPADTGFYTGDAAGAWVGSRERTF
jgi:hypothetical protein